MENHASLHYAALPAQPRDEWLAAWLPRLPPAKRVAIRRLRRDADRHASVLGIALLAAALRARGCEFAPWTLEYPDHGKPRLPAAPDFSIAHADGLVACALAHAGRVGLDVERCDAVRAEQLRLVLDARERERVASGALTPADAWVMKEAVLKAAGEGAAHARAVALHDDRATFAGRDYRLVRVALASTHVAWLATDDVACGDGARAPEPVRHDARALLALPAHA